MTLWTLKLVLTPLLVGLITLSARRWGHRLGGTLAGLPLTSGPVSVFLVLEQGNEFAARAAAATVLGLNAVAAYCLSYALFSRRLSVGLSVGLSTLGLLFINFLLLRLNVPLLVAFPLTLIVIVVAHRVLERINAGEDISPERLVPAWDIPLRMVIAALVITGLTLLARSLGPKLTGLLSPWPVVIAIVAASVHLHAGAAAARQVMHGALAGTVAFALFFFLVSTLLVALGPLFTYAVATVVALAAATFLQRDLRSRP